MEIIEKSTLSVMRSLDDCGGQNDNKSKLSHHFFFLNFLEKFNNR